MGRMGALERQRVQKKAYLEACKKGIKEEQEKVARTQSELAAHEVELVALLKEQSAWAEQPQSTVGRVQQQLARVQ